MDLVTLLSSYNVSALFTTFLETNFNFTDINLDPTPLLASLEAARQNTVNVSSKANDTYTNTQFGSPLANPEDPTFERNEKYGVRFQNYQPPY